MRLVVTTAAVFALTACATPRADLAAAPERDRIDVVVRAPAAVATDRAKAAFLAESLAVASADGGIVRSEIVVLKALGMMAARHITYTATVVGETDSTSRVTVIAYEQELERDARDLSVKRAQYERDPVTSHQRGPFVAVWQRVERIAARLAPE